jgi:uncharacterized protein (DUF302 family)
METKLGFTVTLQTDLAAATTLVTDALKAEGFGVLTEIDVKETMKTKLGVDYTPYKILGACNPALAHRALMLAPEVDLLLPCNVILRQLEARITEVSLVDPLAMLAVVGNPDLQTVAQEARSKLERVAASLAD